MPSLDHNDPDERPLEPQRLARLEALLAQGLERRHVPSELSDRVRSMLSSDEAGEAERVRSIVAHLDRHHAPAELRDRVAATLRSDDAELERRAARLESWLAPIAAPDELRERVQLELNTELSVASALRGLERQRAPHVLERLVDEEIRDDKAVAKRFVGSLPKPGAPRDLDLVARLAAEDARRSNASPGVVLTGPWRRAIAAAVLLLATGSIAWVVIDGDGTEPIERPAFRLQGRQVASIDEFHPMARGLAEGLGVLDGNGTLSDESRTTDGGGR
ncbi:hypothetical protein Pla163_01070 [Planctomycetes bacterium Pla163]|uniref:Uncharacterized protein n=1 Tax=Rohdeia mirabilis TaxID=2528008 RepID=A0A518CUX0_9BACT|nr:hypothetical protein Pla163_01070 [Planctomycetes bacterium Pla163]